MTKNISGPIPARIPLPAKYADGRSSQPEPGVITETTVPTVFTASIWTTTPATGIQTVTDVWSPSESG